MEIFKIVGVGFVTAISAILLKQTKPELAFAVTIAGVIIVLMLAADMLEETLGALDSISRLTGVENGLVKILLKIVGIGYLTEFAAGILEDFGSPSVADKVVLAGKLTIVAASLPLISRVLSVLNTFLGMI